MANLSILAAVPLQATARFREGFAAEPQFEITLVTDLDNALAVLDDASKQIEVFVIDNALGNIDAYEVVKEIRQTYPRLIIILVDEEADFALPGRADDVSTTPFENNDLVNRIKRLNEDRRLQTLRADALPPVRAFAKQLLKAGKGVSKQQAAVAAVQEIGYDYVAFYSIKQVTPPELSLVAQVGAEEVLRLAPKNPNYQDSVMGWVAQNGQSRIVTPEDEPNHPFVLKKQFQSAVCVPVGTTLRFGVLFACRVAPSAISGENVLMLELVSAQLASALAKDQHY